MIGRRLKAFVKRTRGLSDVARVVERAIGRWGARRFNSSAYWDARYRHGGTSGSGSYSRLAKFKAEILNAFVRTQEISTIIEFGSGDGSQLKLAQYPSYIGVDISPVAIQQTRSLFADDPTKQFFHANEFPRDHSAELTLSLDVIYHLVEDHVFHAHMEQLFLTAEKFVVIYASNFDRRDAAHVRHRRFTDWIELNAPDFRLLETIKNPYPWNPRSSDDTSFADFFVFARVVDHHPENV